VGKNSLDRAIGLGKPRAIDADGHLDILVG